MENINKNQMITISADGKVLGDKWYKFLVYFAIWFGVVTNIVIGILYITGNIYMGASSFIYDDNHYPSLENTDFIYGIYRVIFGIFLIFVGLNMLKRKVDATNLLYGASIAVILTGFTYSFISASNVAGSLITNPIYDTVWTSFISSYPLRKTVMVEFGFALYGFIMIAVGVASLVWNMLYFSKREDWFAKKKELKIKK